MFRTSSPYLAHIEVKMSATKPQMDVRYTSSYLGIFTEE